LLYLSLKSVDNVFVYAVMLSSKPRPTYSLYYAGAYAAQDPLTLALVRSSLNILRHNEIENVFNSMFMDSGPQSSSSAEETILAILGSRGNLYQFGKSGSGSFIRKQGDAVGQVDLKVEGSVIKQGYINSKTMVICGSVLYAVISNTMGTVSVSSVSSDTFSFISSKIDMFESSSTLSWSCLSRFGDSLMVTIADSQSVVIVDPYMQVQTIDLSKHVLDSYHIFSTNYVQLSDYLFSVQINEKWTGAALEGAFLEVSTSLCSTFSCKWNSLSSPARGAIFSACSLVAILFALLAAFICFRAKRNKNHGSKAEDATLSSSDTFTEKGASHQVRRLSLYDAFAQCGNEEKKGRDDSK
jgi:hypothetical protein